MDPRLDLTDDLFVESSRAFLAIARDEGNGVALVEQLHDGFHLNLANLQVLSDSRAIERSDIVHPTAPAPQTGGDPEVCVVSELSSLVEGHLMQGSLSGARTREQVPAAVI